MQKTRIQTEEKERKPIPRAKLTNVEGAFILGKLQWKGVVGIYKKACYLLSVIDTNASTVLFNKTTKLEEEASVVVGDTVSVNGSMMLDKYMAKIEVGEEVEIKYTGKGKASPGKRAPFLFEVSRITR